VWDASVFPPTKVLEPALTPFSTAHLLKLGQEIQQAVQGGQTASFVAERKHPRHRTALILSLRQLRNFMNTA